jgi:hypothetical protein
LDTKTRNKVIIAALNRLTEDVRAALTIPMPPAWDESNAIAHGQTLVLALGRFMDTVLFGTDSKTFANALLSSGATVATDLVNTALYNVSTNIKSHLVAALRHIVAIVVLRLGMHTNHTEGDIPSSAGAHVPVAAVAAAAGGAGIGPLAAAAAGSPFFLEGVFNEVRDFLDNERHGVFAAFAAGGGGGAGAAARARALRAWQGRVATFNFCRAVLGSHLFVDFPVCGSFRDVLAGEGITPGTEFPDWAALIRRIQTTHDLAVGALEAAHRAAILHDVPSLTAFARTAPGLVDAAKSRFWANCRAPDQAKILWKNIAKALEDDGTMAAGLALRKSQCLGFPYASSWMGPMEYRVVRGSCIVRGSLNVPCHWGGFLPSGSRIGFALNPALPWELPLDTLFDTEAFRRLGFLGADLQSVAIALKDALLADLRAGTPHSLLSPAAMFQGMVAPSGRDMAAHAVAAPFLLPPLFQARVSTLGPAKTLDPFAPVAGEKVFWCGTAADGPAMPQFFDADVLRASLQEADLQLLLSPNDKNPRFVDATKTTRFTRVILDM